jgi:hypothetical protein
MTEPGPTPKKFAVALSYAGRQRDYVQKVAHRLRERGVSHYFDRDQQVAMWGTHLAEELPRIYEDDAQSVVMFISAEYAAKDWPRLERRAAFSRAAKERSPYVLPARFDDTPLPGLVGDVVYADLKDTDPAEFADQIVDWLVAINVLGQA